jgi:predicted enzyme related to lactoylglutathione lyase
MPNLIRGRDEMADHGTFYSNELMTREPEKACAFYTETLGWRFEDMPMPDGI